jgi:hypothetical protein
MRGQISNHSAELARRAVAMIAGPRRERGRGILIAHIANRMPAPAYQTLSLHLWDIRAQLEAQIRCLTKVHPTVDAWPNTNTGERIATRADLLKDFDDLVRATKLVADLATEAHRVALQLPLGE